MAADKYQGEAVTFFKSLRFHVDRNPDAHFNVVGKTGKTAMVFPDKGAPDIRVSQDDRSAQVEIKTGQGPHQERFNFSQFDDDKRKYYFNKLVPTGNSLWFFITMGESITAQKYKRITLLVPVTLILRLEQELAPKKSVSYAIAAAQAEWLLAWEGKSVWSMSPDHPFHAQYVQHGDLYDQSNRSEQVKLHGLGGSSPVRSKPANKARAVRKFEDVLLL